MQTHRRPSLDAAASSALLAYRNLLSPILLDSCRFFPTCSAYAEEAMRRHGVLRGGWLTALRLVRCHPFAGCGFDPVEPYGHPRGASSPTLRMGRHPAPANDSSLITPGGGVAPGGVE